MRRGDAATRSDADACGYSAGSKRQQCTTPDGFAPTAPRRAEHSAAACAGFLDQLMEAPDGGLPIVVLGAP